MTLPPWKHKGFFWLSGRAFLGLGLFFVLALPLAKALLGGAALFVILFGWAGGIALGVWAFLRAWKEIRT